jgi:hypothetical protein
MDTMKQIFANAKASARDEDSRRGALLEIAKSLRAADDILVAGLDSKAPTLNGQEAQRHLTAAVDAHHQWIVSQRARVGAISSANQEMAKQAGDAADRFAANEATALILTERALRIKE